MKVRVLPSKRSAFKRVKHKPKELAMECRESLALSELDISIYRALSFYKAKLGEPGETRL